MTISPQQIEELRQRGLTDTQIQQLSGQDPSASGPKTFGGFVTESVPNSLGQFVTDVSKGLINVFNPNPENNTLANIARLGVGAGTKLIPGDQGKSEQFFNDALNFYKERYSSDNVGNTLYEDPIGVVSDFALFLSGAGSAVKVAGTTSRLGEVSSVGSKIQSIGTTIDPGQAMISAAGTGLEKLTSGRNVSLPGSRSRVDTNAIAASGRLGVDTTSLPASAVNKSRVLTAIEAYNAKGFFGNKAVDAFESGMSQLNNIADNFVQNISSKDSLSDVGDAISDGIARYKTSWFKEKNKLYGEASDLINKVDSEIPATDTLSTLNSLIEKRKLAAGLTPIGKDVLDVLTDMRDRLSGKDVDKAYTSRTIDGETIIDISPPKDMQAPTLTAMRATLTQINNKAKPRTGDPVVVSDQAAFRAVAQAMSNDIDRALASKLNTPEGAQLVAKLDAANKLYQEGLEKMNSTLGKKIKRLAKEPDRIVDLFIAPSTSVEDVIRMMQIMGPEALPALRRSIVEKVFQNARNADGNFRPEGLNRELQKMGEKLDVLFDQDQRLILQDLDVLSQSMGRVSKVLTGSQTAFMGRIAALIGTFGAISPIAGLKLLAGDYLFNKFIDSGAGQKFLRGELELGGAVGRKVKGSAETAGRVGGAARAVEISTEPQYDQR